MTDEDLTSDEGMDEGLTEERPKGTGEGVRISRRRTDKGDLFQKGGGSGSQEWGKWNVKKEKEDGGEEKKEKEEEEEEEQEEKEEC